MRRQERVSIAQTIAIAFVGFALLRWLNAWLLAGWVIALAGIVGSASYQRTGRWQRLAYLVVFAYLVALLVVIILPEIAPRPELSPEIRDLAEHGLPAILLAAMLLPGGKACS